MYYIMTLGVLAVHRRLGIGAEILSTIIEYAKEMDMKCIGLHVHVENRAALNFYDRFGFRILGTVDNYYKKISPNSAFILELKLV
jgi:ribosomal protein S18 acetylase RimI-like enzyme